ncbi:hypothetical protein RUM43_011112 [Polyplax serrata]|uniref:Uncharacterized protein n=1 Tax=Polyplax serrata TaxID=468196 RepID=A0AAN8NT80_POLSC
MFSRVRRLGGHYRAPLNDFDLEINNSNGSLHRVVIPVEVPPHPHRYLKLPGESIRSKKETIRKDQRTTKNKAEEQESGGATIYWWDKEKRQESRGNTFMST